MTDAEYEAKFKEMQKYIPFLQRVIEKLKVNNEQQAENPRKAQLQKMEMLHELLTNKAKKIKMETLIKCEGVLIKLHAKIEKSEDSILNNVKLKPVLNNPSTSNTTTPNAKDIDFIDLSGPASPPPENIPIDIDQPVVIPTERRCSPILVEEEPGFTRRSGHHSKTDDKYDHHKKSTDKQYSSESHTHDSRQSINNNNNNNNSSSSSKHSHDSVKHDYHRHHSHHSHRDSRKDGHNAKNHKSIPTHVTSNWRSKNLPEEDQIKRVLSSSKSPTTSQKLQTVKVVITEPLGDHVKQKHFPTSNKFTPRTSICHDNLKTLPQVNNADCDDAYSPEELWEEYNDSNKKTNSSSTKPSIFHRLGDKVVELAQTFSHSNTKAPTSTTGRYTPIPDVLKSPPLSVTDINNLLLESGLEKDPNDISEIGTRRAPKTEDHQIKIESSPSNTLEFARRKLAQTARLYSPNSEAQKSPLSTENPLSSPLPNERIALKYNPHPRQERLQSISSTEGSECSIPSKIIDPRIKSKLPSSNLISPINVNVLPTINLNDPRLKKQNTNTYESATIPTPTAHNQLPGYINPNLISYAGKVDPRMSRVVNNPLSGSQTMPPYGGSSTNKQHYNCEEKWSTMESADKPRVQIKTNPRVEKRGNVENKFDSRYCANKNISLNAMPDRRRSISQSRFVSGSETEYVKPNAPKSDSEEDWDKDLEKEKQIVKEKSVSQQEDKKKFTNSKNPNVNTDIRNNYLPRPPNSDTEEDWDSEPEPTTFKAKSNVPTSASENILTNNASVPELSTPIRMHVSPKTFANILKTPTLPLPPPQHSLQHPYGHSLHPIVAATSPHSMSTPPTNIRFIALQNDKTEREKYFESKKQKPFQPRTYKEFREAKERQQAQAAAMKRAAEAEAEAKKRDEELKEAAVKDNETNASEKREQKTCVPSKVVESKVEKNHNQVYSSVKTSHLSKDHVKTLASESTLDKMYRTQNFGSTFPKASTSFKIPKKKSDEKPKEETTNKTETKKETLNDTLNQESGKKLFTEKSKNAAVKAAIDSSHIENTNNVSTKTKETKDNQNKNPKQKQKETNKEKNTPGTVATTDSKEEEELSKQTDAIMLTKKSIRDPRFRSKNISNEMEENVNTKEESMHVLNDIIIKSSESEVVLKPQQKLENVEEKNKSALEKFNEITKTLSPKPQRIMRRRNTMVAFESEPLVDKDKLRKANAMLFEDIQEEEKRKQKQKEEDRQNARRNKNLEEMFQKTDDNCTVSTQNIITGKRRTRATINFNETVNAMNVFKHTSKKGTAGSANSITPTAQPSPQTNGKNTRLNSKRGAKSSDVLEDNKSIEDESENVGKVIESKETKTSSNADASKSNEELISSNDGTKIKPIKTKLKLCIKLPKKRPPAYLASAPTATTTTATVKEVKKEAKFKPIQDEEHQNCAVSSTSTENPSEDQPVCSTSSGNSSGSFKKEADDNEPTSTASKSNNSTPTPEASVQVLEEIVDKMLKPNADRVHILSLLGQILSEEKLELIKSLIQNNTQQLDEQETNKEGDANKPEIEENEGTDATTEEKPSTVTNVQEENPDEKPMMKQKKLLGSCKKMQQTTKKKRTELDRLNEDIRDMFICEGVLTATGRRMCTIMGQSNNKDSESSIQNKSTPDTSPTVSNGNDNIVKKKELRSHADKNKVSAARPLRRSVRGCKTANEDDDIETTEESIDESNITSESNSNDSSSTPQRKMPVLKPNTPLKIPEEEEEEGAEEQIDENIKKVKNKRKSDTKSSPPQTKKVKKTNKDDLKENAADSEYEKESEIGDLKTETAIKNTNINWHNQSKFTTWCMICEKRLHASSSALHYKIHHGENYISRLAPVILLQFKQGKLCKPLFGVDKSPKQSSWFYRCPFCLQYFNTTLTLWLEHFHNHTTEFRYECSKCHRSSNRAATIRRHVKCCGRGASMLNSAIKLSIPTQIKGHVCHLCNFLQLRRTNLERHYIEQHNLDKNTVELLGHTITLFDFENIETVSEANAAERENEAWELIEKDEKVIDLDDDDDRNSTSSKAEKTNSKADECITQSVKEVKEVELINEESFKSTNDPTTDMDANNINEETQTNTERKNFGISKAKKNQGDAGDHETQKENHEAENTKESETAKNIDSPEESVQHIKVQSENIESSTSETIAVAAATNIDLTEAESGYSEYELINERETAQDIQDELLALAGKAAESNDDNNVHTTAEIQLNEANVEPQTSISDIISSSIDMIYSRDAISDSNSSSSNKRKSSENHTTSEAKKSFPNIISNVFMPTRDENNSSPTIQILAQSIINIEEEAQQSDNPLKSISIAERLSQRFKGLQSRETLNSSPNITAETTQAIAKEKCKENPFEKLINDTVMELEREKDSLIPMGQYETKDKPAENEKSVDDKAEEESKKKTEVESEKEKTDERSEIITVLSDDEDWEDIEITETAPVACSANTGNIQKSKSKGLFQKFGIFKGNTSKSKKHIQPLVFLPKKKTKEKSLSASTTSSPSPTTATKTNTTALTATKADLQITDTNTHVGFKPVANIMDDLLPDSPCNDPIDLVPELAPLEPLQDLNDISSILDSHLSGGALESSVNINASEHHASIEDALDFISEQQASDTQLLTTTTLKTLHPSQGKTIINSMSHVGYSIHNASENVFKFYCLLQNCSFLFSSDSIGLETHFMCEHNQIKWDGHCSMCQTQCFPIVEGNDGYPISKEIRHMMDKHVNKPNIELNIDSTTQHSTTSSQGSLGSEEKPKIKIRRLTGDCLSRAALEEDTGGSNPSTESVRPLTNNTVRMSMLGALLVAKPKPPTKEMPPQPQMPLTEPLLLDNNIGNVASSSNFKNISNDFLITSVTSAADTLEKQSPLQISNVISLQGSSAPMVGTPEQTQLPTILNVRTLGPEGSDFWPQQSDTDQRELVESATESLEVSQILANAGKPSLQRDTPRAMDDSPGPVVVAETVPLAQNKTGEFLITQTVSAQYNDCTSAAVGFNISIAAAPNDNSNKDALPVPSSIPVTSRHYRCMANGCKFISRVRVAMSDHLRFHERRNFSNKRDYFDCGFCSYHASDLEDYMKHTDQYHIINKSGGGAASVTASINSESDTANSLTKKIHDILNSTSGSSRNNTPTQLQIQTVQVQDSHEVYLKKLKETIDEIVGPTGLADDQLYRCVVKNCRIQLTESTFLNHIMFHISTTSTNPNNYVFKCPHCTAQYHRAAGIKAHIKNHARNRYFCYLCEHTSTNPGQLLKHFSEKHWHTLNMYTHELLKPKTAVDGSAEILDSAYYVVYTQELGEEEVRKFGEKLILDWQRKKSGSKTHFKSTEIELLPLSAIFKHEVNCGECEYKTKVRTNMYRHLQMHKQNRGLSNNSGASKVCSVDPVNPVPCLNSNERFFDKMTNLASSSLVPSSSAASNSNNNNSNPAKTAFKIPYKYIVESKRYSCGSPGCIYLTISEDNFRTHISTLHSSVMSYRCTFCQEEICKRGISIERIVNHLRFHGATIYRCEECNYVHHLRYVVERHINEKHATLKVNLITHERSSEDNEEGTMKILQFTGKKYRETMENSNAAQTSASPALRSTNYESSTTMSTSTNNTAKGKGKWICDVCGHRASNVSQIQNHCQQQHGVKNQYKCAHCNFGSQQLSQILYHIDEKHSGKTREARYMYHKSANSNEEVADTRPLWQRNDPTRIRHIRGILMEDEEESEQYRKKLGLTDDLDDDETELANNKADEEENNDQLDATNYIKGYEFGCFHCDFKTQVFEDLKTKHYTNVHNSNMEMAKPFWFRLHRRLCCPECRSFIGNCNELQQHIQTVHKKNRYYAADITVAENEDSSHRIQCGYCSFHCANVEHLYRHHIRVQHLPQDIRLDDNKQLSDILNLGQQEVSYQCSLCSEIFSNRVAIVQHACNVHSGDSFSFKDLINTCFYHCIACNFASTEESVTLRHMIDHYNRFAVCHFCRKKQSSFNVYMQHCYAEHRMDIQKFKTIYTLSEIRKYLMKMYVILPNGLVLTKRNLLNTIHGSTYIIEELYEEMYRISQQPPIPRLSIARLVARKSIEAQQKQHEPPVPIAIHQAEVLEVMQSQSRLKTYSRRKSTVAASQEDQVNMPAVVEPKPATIQKRRTTVYHDNPVGIGGLSHTTELKAPEQTNKISKRRRTVAVDRDTLFSTNLSSSPDSLLIERELIGKKPKLSYAPSSPQHDGEAGSYPLNLDMEPFSFYGQKPETMDLSKIFTKVVIGGIKTPLTIDKFKLLFNIECQLKLTKCDDGLNEILAYKDYKHIRKACPASHKLKYK